MGESGKAESPIRTKSPIRETIPDRFKRFLRDVVEAINQGDESAWMESDDLLQSERAYGGLYDTASGRYGFAYFIEDDEESDVSCSF